MHIQSAVLFGLAALGAQAFPSKPKPKPKPKPIPVEEQCRAECISTFITPFVTSAGQEGFRQALGAHNTTGVCMADPVCRDTIQTFVEEITDMVVKDRTIAERTTGDGKPYHWVQGFHEEHCDADCLVLAAQTAAGQAGVVAMAVGQKHFYGTDQIWKRWAPRQMLELDMAMLQLRGMEKLNTLFGPTQQGGTGPDISTRPIFDQNIFRYQGISEVPLLGRKVRRIEAQKILSFVPDFGVNMTGIDSTEKDGLFLGGEGHGTLGPSIAIMPEKLSHAMEDAIGWIRRAKGEAQRQGWTYFLWQDRLSGPDGKPRVKMTPRESWRRLLRDLYSNVTISDPAEKEVYYEDQAQAKKWSWIDSAYGVDPNQVPTPAEMKLARGLHLTQWVADSQMTPVKGVDGKLTNQPWTTPWFYEYSSNVMTMEGLNPNMTEEQAQEYIWKFKDGKKIQSIRGYMQAFKLNREGNFSPHDLFWDEGEIKNLQDIELQPAVGDYTPLYAVTTDARVFARWAHNLVEHEGNKVSWEVLDPERKPLYTEDGKPITIIYDKQTGLLETRYGRSKTPLDDKLEALA